MEPAPAGDSLALVVRLQPAANGGWCVYVDGLDIHQQLTLAPMTLVLRLWRSKTTGVLRAVVQLQGSQHSAAIQGNTQIVELVQAWLQGGAGPGDAPAPGFSADDDTAQGSL